MQENAPDRVKNTVVYMQIDPGDIALFRFLLEAYGHVGYFSVLERHTALLKFVCPYDMRERANIVLREIAFTVPFALLPSPFAKDPAPSGLIE